MCSHSPAYTQCQILCCYTCGSVSAGATYPCRATLWHVVTEGTCEFCCSAQFILVGAVYHNALTNCATRVCCACADPPTCVAERYLTLRTGCSRGRTPKVVRPQQRKNPLPFPYFAAVTCRQSAPDPPRERGDSQEGGNRRCLPSCAPARRQRKSPAAGTTPYPRRGAKRKGHLRFPFLFELLPFPCFLICRRFPICDRFEKDYGSRVTVACLSPPFRSSQTAYCYTDGLRSAGRGIAVPRNSLARYDRQHLRG